MFYSVSNKSCCTQRRIAEQIRGAPLSYKGLTIPAAGITSKGVQVFRNVASAIPSVGPKNSFVNNLGFGVGPVWLFLGMNEILGGKSDLQHAQRIGDGEGSRRAKARLLSGSFVTAGSVSYLTGKTIDAVNVGQAASTGLGFSANALFGAGSILAFCMSSLGLWRTLRFRARLNEKLQTPNTASEAVRYLNAIQFLKSTITVSDKEKCDIQARIQRDYVDLTKAQQEKLIEQQIMDRMEVKMRYFKRRTSHQALVKILDRMDPLIAQLSDPNQKVRGIGEAKRLISEVQWENRKKTLLYIVAFIAASIGIAALILGTFFTFGTLPFILYAISSFVYLGLSIHALSQRLHHKEPELPGVNLPPLPDTN